MKLFSIDKINRILKVIGDDKREETVRINHNTTVTYVQNNKQLEKEKQQLSDKLKKEKLFGTTLLNYKYPQDNYILVKDLSDQYKPIILHEYDLDYKFPTVNFNSKISAFHSDDDGIQSTASWHSKRTFTTLYNPIQKKPRITKIQKQGYCENCNEKYSDFDNVILLLIQHFRNGKHVNFAKNNNNYYNLDATRRRLKPLQPMLSTENADLKRFIHKDDWKHLDIEGTFQ
ncbi:hypothetical protein HDV01_003879 [Terramyces sp. JEL0728]|nr:hypothetical protein HDV01_003879 [Terramyces sp. JEL0728]